MSCIRTGCSVSNYDSESLPDENEKQKSSSGYSRSDSDSESQYSNEIMFPVYVERFDSQNVQISYENKAQQANDASMGI